MASRCLARDKAISEESYRGEVRSHNNMMSGNGDKRRQITFRAYPANLGPQSKKTLESHSEATLRGYLQEPRPHGSYRGHALCVALFCGEFCIEWHANSPLDGRSPVTRTLLCPARTMPPDTLAWCIAGV